MDKIVTTLRICSCNSENIKVKHSANGTIWVECADCGKTGPEAQGQKDAIRKWNDMHPQPIECITVECITMELESPEYWALTEARKRAEGHSYIPTGKVVTVREVYK
jgi:hypothetical protein